MYLCSTIYNRLFKSKQHYSIKHEKTVSISTIKLFSSTCFYSSDLDGQNRRNEPERIFMSKKAESRSHTHVVTSSPRTNGSLKVFVQPEQTFPDSRLFWTPKQSSFCPDFKPDFAWSIYRALTHRRFLALLHTWTSSTTNQTAFMQTWFCT